MLKKEILEKLVSILGSENVVMSPEVLEAFSQDMTENHPSLAEVIVNPSNPEEIRDVLRVADEAKIPVTPVVSGANMGGLTIPVKGGIVLDLKKMNRIVEVDDVDMYAVIEPGVTFGQLRSYLEERHPTLTYGQTLSPPFTSVMCNALLDGLSNLSHKHGSMSEWLSGVEAVLPAGDIVKCGSAAISEAWFARGPLPDLLGLFINWQGTTGVVTKAAVELWPKPLHVARFLILSYNAAAAFESMRRCSRMQMFDELAAVSWPGVKIALGARGSLKKVEGEPEYYVFLELSGDSAVELEGKVEGFQRSVEPLRRELRIEPPLWLDPLLASPRKGDFASGLSSALDLLFDFEKGGLTWVGTYGPTRSWEEGAHKGSAILEEHGFPPLIVARSMKGGHFGVLRFIVSFDKRSSSEMNNVRVLTHELAEALLEVGFVPYKAPGWTAKMILERAQPGFVQLLSLVKRTLDPNGIMNPGKWAT